MLSREFYRRPTLKVARDLLGKTLVHRTPEGTTRGIIVEVEAYIGEDDAACHAAPGPTRRNAPMYGEPGHAYVYLNYGIHSLMNIVTEPPGSPAAVLVRALEPIEGVRLMRQRRQVRGAPARPDHELCRGPGNLTRALGITLEENGADLLGRRLYIEDAGRRVEKCAWSPRVGIRVGTDRLWRCYALDSRAVSGRRWLKS
ncbi:MAG: DNA-3-methyladenine glycosylase [Acidobacteria bacterium]|nr:DNA-3-methyladenine glycosylase [Acidobacteriota bacterium]MBI3265023.1 DNA-3-methyladenine glycosylase [Acidobacteriota bacterium]